MFVQKSLGAVGGGARAPSPFKPLDPPLVAVDSLYDHEIFDFTVLTMSNGAGCAKVNEN